MEDSFVYLYGKKLVKFILKGVPSPLYLAMQYRFMTGEKLHFKNPRLFDEKIQQLKLMDKNPLMSVCADKFRVREYVKGCGLGDILNEIYGVYHRAGEIDFSVFKSEVFLKCNNRSGANIIYKKNQPFDKEKFAREFNGYLKDNYYY
ncbi:MAG: ATP-grasp fold amidoligase family protein, partial [Oscillospiraceae bacterium]